MRKIWVVLALALVLAGLGGGEAGAAESWAPVYLNGEKSELRALTVNGTSYLPLRDLAEVFALDIDWNQGEKLVELRLLDKRTRVWVERKSQAVGYMGEDGDIYWDNEWDLGFEPLLRGGKVWLALRFFEDLTEAEVSWDEEKQGVWIEGIPIWQGGRWTVGRDEDWQTGAPVKDGSGRVSDVSWLTLWRGADGTLGSDYLWRLGAGGERQRIASDWDITDLKVYGDKCYYLSSYRLMAPVYDIYVADGESGQVARLGQKGFVYNTSISNKGYLAAGRSGDLPVSWWVDKDGAWAVGFDRSSMGDEAIINRELAQETYGLYRLWVGGHELVKKYDLPK